MVRRANARKHEYLGRTKGAGRENDLIGVDVEEFSARFDGCSDGAVAVEQQPVDEAIGSDCEIHSMSRLRQVSDVGAPSDAVRVVEGWWPDAGGVGVVGVLVAGISESLAGLDECVLILVPLFRLPSAAQNGAFGAVVVVGKVGIGLDAPEVGHEFLERPFVVAPLSPIVVIFGQSSEKDLGVYGAGSADEFSAGNLHFGIEVVSAGGEVPVVLAVFAECAGPDVAVEAVSEFDLHREVVDVWVVWTGFEEEDGDVGVFAEAGSDDGACGTGTDDDEVVFHWNVSEDKFRVNRCEYVIAWGGVGLETREKPGTVFNPVFWRERSWVCASVAERRRLGRP